MNDNPFGDGGGFPPARSGNNPEWVDRLKKFMKKGGAFIIAAIILIILAFNSIYILNSGQQGVITRFGAYVSTEVNTGLKFKLPFVESVNVIDFEMLRPLEFGYRTQASSYENMTTGDVSQESTMLTGDLNIVIANWTVFYKVSHSYNWMFKVANPNETLRIVSESTYRRIVATYSLDDILTNKKDIIAGDIKTDLQSICDKYELGVEIRDVQLQDATAPKPVEPAFNDVSAAKEEKESKINEARKYENEKLPIAEGQAVKLKNDAAGYKAQRVNEALGITARYTAIEKEYLTSPGIMRTRLYLEMIQEVLPKVKTIYFVDERGNTLNFLPLLPGSANLAPAQQ